MNHLRLLWAAIPLMMSSSAALAQVGTVSGAPDLQQRTVSDSAAGRTAAGKNLPAVLIVQRVNKDSLKLVASIAKDSIKLVRLQAKLAEATKNKDQATIKAQQIANENNQAAAQLSEDPLHKKNARKVERLSSEARKAATKARSATNDFNAVSKDIAAIRRSLSKKQKKLNKVRAAALKPDQP